MAKKVKTEQGFWDELPSLEVVDILVKALAAQWGISVNFIDIKGNLRLARAGKLFNPANPVCAHITATERGYRDRRETAFRLATELAAMSPEQLAPPMTDVKATISTCMTGVAVIAVPVAVQGTLLGAVYADGFLREESPRQQKANIIDYLGRIGTKDKSVLASIDRLEVLDTKSLKMVESVLSGIVAEFLIAQYGPDYRSLPAALEGSTPLKKISDSKKIVVGTSKKMQELFETLNKIKDTESAILITGENGTGKEMVAHKIHTDSKRRKGHFIAINCGAFNANLLESELFGHVKGSFTGADKDKKGLFEVAGNGTLFLDEVGEMTLAMQVKLLRVLQEKTFTPVGGIEEKKSTARIVAATNRDLRNMIKEKSFREDLFYRLNVINITMPALRERPDDIPVLVDHFIEKHYDKIIKTVDPEAMTVLQEYTWPGNVRQLENEIRRALVLSEGDVIKVSDLSERVLADVKQNRQVS